MTVKIETQQQYEQAVQQCEVLNEQDKQLQTEIAEQQSEIAATEARLKAAQEEKAELLSECDQRIGSLRSDYQSNVNLLDQLREKRKAAKAAYGELYEKAGIFDRAQKRAAKQSASD